MNHRKKKKKKKNDVREEYPVDAEDRGWFVDKTENAFASSDLSPGDAKSASTMPPQHVKLTPPLSPLYHYYILFRLIHYPSFGIEA